MQLLPAFTGVPESNQVYNCDALTLLRALPSGSVDAVITDPPYLMTKRGNSCRPNWMRDGMGENLFDGELPVARDWMSEVFRILKNGTHFYTFCSINDITDYLSIAADVGFDLQNIITMIKDTHMPSRWYMKFTEQVLFFRKGEAKPINNHASRDYFTVAMPTQKNGKTHITEKPISILLHMIENSTRPGELVFDPFCGSGSTLDAANRLKRDYIGCDTDYNHVINARRRLIAPYTPVFAEMLTT